MPSDDEKEMNLSGPEEYKQDLNESEAKIVPEGDRKKPPKKRLAEMQSSDDDEVARAHRNVLRQQQHFTPKFVH